MVQWRNRVLRVHRNKTRRAQRKHEKIVKTKVPKTPKVTPIMKAMKVETPKPKTIKAKTPKAKKARMEIKEEILSEEEEVEPSPKTLKHFVLGNSQEKLLCKTHLRYQFDFQSGQKRFKLYHNQLAFRGTGGIKAAQEQFWRDAHAFGRPWEHTRSTLGSL